jgi:hypothetical protein
LRSCRIRSPSWRHTSGGISQALTYAIVRAGGNAAERRTYQFIFRFAGEEAKRKVDIMDGMLGSAQSSHGHRRSICNGAEERR